MRKTIHTGLAALIAATMTQAAYAQTDLPRAVAGGDQTDFALFDGTDPTALEAGVACGAQKGSGEAVPFTYFVTISNWSDSVQVVRVRYNDQVEIARYQIPPGNSFSFSQAAGSTAGVDDVIRVVAETAPPSGLAGTMSLLTGGGAQPPRDLGGEDFCITLTLNP